MLKKLLSLMCLFVVTSAWAAPIPKAKQRSRPSLKGHWVISWSDTRYFTEIEACGRYSAIPINHEQVNYCWVGKAEIKGDELIIEERINKDIEPVHTYRFKLVPGKLKSDCGGLKMVTLEEYKQEKLREAQNKRRDD